MNQPFFDKTSKIAIAPDCMLVIFGASGDLTKRLLMPALYNLANEGLLTPHFSILGIGHHARSDDNFRTYLADAVRERAKSAKSDIEDKPLDWLMQRVTYLDGDFDNPQMYEKIAKRLEEWAKDGGGLQNAIFYLATAPNYFATIVEKLGETGLLKETNTGWRRVIVEKPIGHDLASAQELNTRLLQMADESQIYRIDHFLGKETVQNIMVLRFANFMFEPIWNREHIDHIQITAAESIGVEQRGRFYDETGALRDMVPNHMFQLLAMMTMEAPNSFAADAIRAEKAKVIEAIRRVPPHEAIKNSVRGQYVGGVIGERYVEPYASAANVDPRSQTETYFAMKLFIDNWRWMDVPFYIRTGKAMSLRRTEIVIQFKKAPGVLFRDTEDTRLSSCRMIFHIQPEEGITLRFTAKKPGRKVQLADVNMDFRYADYFKTAPSTGYETLIYDCLVGDATLFQRADNVEAGWAGVQPILDAWKMAPAELHLYPAGTNGPAAADALLQRDGRQWLPLQ